MERQARHGGKSLDRGSRHSALGVDAQKKTLAATERNEAARTEYRARVRGRRTQDFVIVDECGSNINLTPRYAHAPRGTRAIGSVPRNTERNLTLIASMTTTGMGAARTLDGAPDTAAFESYIEHVLAPMLIPGQVLVIDNLSAHKSLRVRTLIETCGCEIWFLPSYSPDVSPIEEAFSKLKTLLRRAAARTSEALQAAIAHALEHCAE